MPPAPLTAVEEPVNRLASAEDFQEQPAQESPPEEPQPKQPLMADIIKFPEHIYLKAKELPVDQRLRLAGQLAAEVLKRYPHLIQQLGSTTDPVPAWTILRNVVMRQLEQHLANEPSAFGHGL
jgi:hypothetical protein